MACARARLPLAGGGPGALRPDARWLALPVMDGRAPKPASDIEGVLLRHAQHLERGRWRVERLKHIVAAIIAIVAIGRRREVG